MFSRKAYSFLSSKLRRNYANETLNLFLEKMSGKMPEVPYETDIVIVGGGLVGMMCAYFIKQLSPLSYTVTVVDKDLSVSDLTLTSVVLNYCSNNSLLVIIIHVKKLTCFLKIFYVLFISCLFFFHYSIYSQKQLKNSATSLYYEGLKQQFMRKDYIQMAKFSADFYRNVHTHLAIQGIHSDNNNKSN